MVNGCHSDLEISGILTKIQSPGEYANFDGRWMIRFVTFPGNKIPAWTEVFPEPMRVRRNR